MEDGVVMETKEGSPQGGPLSPLLANIYLDEFDMKFEVRLKSLTSRRHVQPIRPALEKIKVYARGWLNYYGIASMKNNLEEINQWIL